MHVVEGGLTFALGGNAIQAQKILIADDEFLIRWSLSQALSKEGHEVITVEDGGQAIDLASTQNFDYVITDLAMPGIDGWKVLDVLTRRRPSPRVIVMTAHGEEDTRKTVEEKGGWAYVEKTQLIDGIKKVLRGIFPGKKS